VSQKLFTYRLVYLFFFHYYKQKISTNTNWDIVIRTLNLLLYHFVIYIVYYIVYVAQSPKLKDGPEIIHQIVYDIPYDSVCGYVRVQPLSAQRSELGRRFFFSVTIFDSCLYDLPQRQELEILSQFWQHTVQFHKLRPINITLLLGMPWLSINNVIHKNSTLHCIRVCWCLYTAICRTQLWSYFYFVVFVLLCSFHWFCSLLLSVYSAISLFRLSATVLKINVSCIYTVSQKMHKLWNKVAQNYKDWFWWHLTVIFKMM